MPNFKQMPMAPSQIVMFPVSVEDSLPADCDVRLLGEAMEALDWRAFEASCADTGRPAYPPKVMCKLLVYGYCKGIRCSRALEEAEAADQAEDELYGQGANGKLPQRLADATRRREKLAEIAARLAESGRSRVSASEEDCRVMKTTGGLRPAYNVQLTVDTASGVIVAADLTQQETDHPPAGGLAGQLDKAAENVGCQPDVALADTGYSDEGAFEWLAQTGQEALIPPQEQSQQAQRNDLFASRCFLPDEGRDVLICPAGRELTFRRAVRCSSGNYRVYTPENCRDCSFYAECVRVKSKRGRSVQVSVVFAEREQMRQRLKTPEGKVLYRLRQQTVERVIAQLKANLRFNRFGLAGVGGGGRSRCGVLAGLHGSQPAGLPAESSRGR